MSLNRRLFRCRITDDKFPTLKKKSKCHTCDKKVSKIRHDGRRIFGRNVRNLGSLDTKILYLERFQKFFSHPYVSLSSSIGFHIQPCSKGSYLHQAPHVCVIPWVSSELVQGLLSFAHMILPIMCLNSQWLQIFLSSL